MPLRSMMPLNLSWDPIVEADDDIEHDIILHQSESDFMYPALDWIISNLAIALKASNFNLNMSDLHFETTEIITIYKLLEDTSIYQLALSRISENIEALATKLYSITPISDLTFEIVELMLSKSEYVRSSKSTPSIRFLSAKSNYFSKQMLTSKSD